MSESRPSKVHPKSGIGIAAMMLGLFIFWGVCDTMEEARHAGHSVNEALQIGLSFQNPWFWGWTIFGLVIAIGQLLYRRRWTSPEARSTYSDWQGQWKGLYALQYISIAVAGLGVITGLLEYVFTRRVDSSHWSFSVNLLLALGIVIIWRATNPVSKEYYQSITTGDESRVNDERTQQVRGKAALTTLSVLAITALLCGAVYESLILGNFPQILASAMGVGYIVWGTSYWYWNRKL